MKIGLVCPYNINKHGGVLEVVLSLNEELTKLGHGVKIITPKPRGQEIKYKDNIIFIGSSTDFRSPSATTTQISSTVDNEKIDEILQTEQFDILHFHEPWVPLLSRQLLQHSKSVNIGTFHSKVPEAIMTRTLIKVVNPYFKSVMNYLHELTAVSTSGAAYAATLTDQPITIIPNGINLDNYSPNKVDNPKQTKTVLYVGRLERRKGVRYLIRAFQLFNEQNPGYELLIAGDGPERERLELLADDLEINNIKFLGFISDDIKKKLMAEAEIFCSPALFGESFGIVLLEAMAMGSTVIAGNNSGYIDVMKDLGALSIVNPEDTSEFARKIELFIKEKKLRDLWGDWSKTYITQFNYPLVVKKYEKFYHTAIKKHHAKILAIT